MRKQPVRSPQVVKLLLMGLALAGYAVLLPVLGFLVATAALCWVTMMLLGRGALRSLVEAVVAALIVRYVFTHGLGVPLPEPQVEILRFLRLYRRLMKKDFEGERHANSILLRRSRAEN